MGAESRASGVVGSLRFRLTAVATIVVLLVLSGSALALVTVQQRQLSANLNRSLAQRADTIGGLLSAAPTDTPLLADDEDRAVQLVDASGTVIAASDNLAQAGPLTHSVAAGIGAQSIADRSDLPLEDDRYRVLSRRIETSAGPAVLHVAENTDDVHDANRRLMTALAITVPLVVVVLAALIWWLTGRALKPVDAIRAEVDAISDTDSNRRIAPTGRSDEIARLATTMNQMLDRLHEAGVRQRRFVADAAHELRTPLTRIRTTVEVDLAQPGDADAATTNEAVREEAIELQELIDDLLHLARSDAGRPRRRDRPVDLDDIVMTEVHRSRADTPTVAIDSTAVRPVDLYGDAQHWERAVRNLLANATRHARSTVSVELEERGGEITLAVSDDGPGVPDSERTKIFERFTRIDDARARSAGGTGLGLAITKDIVEGHGGRIECRSANGGGARFVVRLSSTAAVAGPDEPDQPSEK